MRRRIKSFLLVFLMLVSFAQAEQAQFGGTVFDPKNFVQNLYTASRTLIQIRQQVSQLRNEARMLIGQAK
ncbi:MAG: P-type conjugative transfer protein TrbJ, partial [Devosiaceae bacterium]|nr:P-type conjugative transfer protein TrbJ [Devosiaceae bacterium]